MFKRARHLCLLLPLSALAYDTASLPPLEISEVTAPSGPGANQGVLARGPDGSVWLAWIEPASRDGRVLRAAAFDSDHTRWREPNTIAHGVGPDTPALATGADGQVVAAWLAREPTTEKSTLQLSRSRDAGRHWDSPATLSSASGRPGVGILAGGQILAAWQEGTTLCACLLPAQGKPGARQVLDSQASAGVQPAIAVLPDGGALIAYRGGSGAPGPRLRRLHGSHWEDAHALTTAEDAVAGGEPDSPQIAVDGGRVAAVWRTGTAGGSRILASASPDAGTRFLLARQASAETAAHDAGVVLLHDGAALISWLDSASTDFGGGVWIRRLNPEFQRDPPRRLASAADAVRHGPPRLALLHDYAGNDATARLLAVLTRTGEPTGLRTLLVTVPEGRLLAAEDDDCHCSPTPAQLVGYPVRGTIVAVAPAGDSLTLDLDTVPGVMAAGRQTFRTAPEARIREMKPQVGQSCLARIERKADGWHLFDLRLLEEPR